jgi:hypothetical protein
MIAVSRREFLQRIAALGAVGVSGLPAWTSAAPHEGIPTGPRAPQHESVRVLFPRGRVPLSFIIDDSTCLVNMGHFCMPQFHECYPDRAEYQQPWWTWPREIPDAFVREFGEWCAEHGVKGKYSVVPYPACVGWLDRELPGWPRRQLLESLALVREVIVPHWDITPEMITHTRVIDLTTGRPLEEINPATMENSYPQQKKSVDELAAYIAYALRILKNCGLPCEGITTPGGFGNLVKSELSLAVFEAVRDVFGAEIPHYFKYIVGAGESTQPQLEHVRGLGTDDVRLTVNVVAGTGDWLGGWEGSREPEPDRYAAADASSGRVVELIDQGEPAIFFAHWPGLYCNGTKTGLTAFQRVVTTLEAEFRDRTVWMKLSEIARYWAAKGLTAIDRDGPTLTLSAPFACPAFTLRIENASQQPPQVQAAGKDVPLREVREARQLEAGTWRTQETAIDLCFDLPRGRTTIRL